MNTVSGSLIVAVPSYWSEDAWGQMASMAGSEHGGSSPGIS